MANDTYTVERRTTIDAPPSAIYPHVEDLHAWQAWSPWEDLDPDLDRTYTGPDKGVGASYAWSGNRKAGQGSMTITEASPDQAVACDLAFVKPFKSESKMRMTFAPKGDQTEVVWTLTGPQTLMTKIMGIFTSMDKMIGPDFEKGLARLKATAES